MNVYEKIKAIADQNSLSIQEIEKRSGLGNGSVSKWATSMPKADSLYKVAKILDRSIEYFLTDEFYPVGDEDVPEETELLQNYRKLDRRGQHKLHTIMYEELDRLGGQEDAAQRIPFAASGEADITPESYADIQMRLQKYDKRAKELEGK